MAEIFFLKKMKSVGLSLFLWFQAQRTFANLDLGVGFLTPVYNHLARTKPT
jgi:hypothetical protein